MSSYLPFVISPVVYAVVLSYFFLIGGLSGTLVGVMAGHLLIAFPFATILSFSFWNEHTEKLIEVSRSLGVSQRLIWTQILFPMAKPQLYVVFFQAFLVSWFEYGLTQYIGVGRVKVLTISVFNYVQEADITLAATASLLLVLPPLVLLWINKKYIYPKILSPNA
jgi:putative spermidine/putrescine transport system permease protein